MYINYGSIQYNTEPISALEKWGINISKQNSIDCINSHSDEFAKRESGPILKLCFPENTIPVEEFQKNLEYLHNSENIFFKGKFLLSGIEIQIDSISKTDAQKELNREDINFALIGESNLLNTIDKKENFYYLFGENKNLESSFSLPYFSILATDLENIILFPPSGFFYGNRRDYLLIRIPTGNSFSEKILSFFNSIKTNSEVLKNNCIPSKLTIEEYSGVSSGYTGKFIELVNSSEEIACSKNISIFSNSMKIDIPETSGFIFPGQTIVFKEENSRLEGIEINYPEFWKEITPGKELKIIQENFEQIFSFPKFTFTQDDFEFSYRWKNFTCSNFQLFPKDKNICSNPGISLPVYHKNSCNLNLLRLHELNLDGIQFNRKLEKTGKFIEFIYTGDEKCSIDLFYLETDNSIIPIYSKNHLENEDILLIGNPDFINFPN
ncbi:MAG: hypothetical protein KDK36_05825, partial [Leptospiraceae bacterium]|nr:hypothetical protein [Leptospiraceae bacterium]